MFRKVTDLIKGLSKNISEIKIVKTRSSKLNNTVKVNVRYMKEQPIKWGYIDDENKLKWSIKENVENIGNTYRIDETILSKRMYLR